MVPNVGCENLVNNLDTIEWLWENRLDLLIGTFFQNYTQYIWFECGEPTQFAK